MITKFNKFLTESIRDEMVGKTEKEIMQTYEDKIKTVLPGNTLSMEQIFGCTQISCLWKYNGCFKVI